MADELSRLESWYEAQCDGEWEHQFGVEVGTLDNPGWLVKIDLSGTPLLARPFSAIDIPGDHDWMFCLVKEGRFEAAGGPRMLNSIFREFLNWAAQAA